VIDEYSPGPAGGVKCKLSLYIDGQWYAKEDGADNSDVEAIKGVTRIASGVQP